MQTQPATSGIEYVLDDADTIISKGDLQGNITYVNRDFVKISGYAEAEVMGGPQSILAHPDTPKQVFDDFLRTLKANKTWSGVSKGRRKNGDFFWVEMTAAPIFENHRPVGCITIRAKPGPGKVRAAERAYRQMKAGSTRVAMDGGKIVRRPAFRHLRVWPRLSLAMRISVLAAIPAAILLANLAALMSGDGGGAWLMSTTALGAALCALAPYLLARGIARPLAQLRGLIDEMSEGKLSSGIEVHGDGEIGGIRHSLRILQTNLKLLVSQIQETTEQVNTGARRITSANADLSARTESQSNALRQAAASLEELISTVTDNADNAHEANALAVATSGMAANGKRAVGEVIRTMGSIRDSSRRIADIIGVIDGIAFQTNILALNAAVEAARAGEQGRGFAVVASEVRGLAGRSADAAREIKSLIGDSVQQVEAGSKLVDDAGATITEIVNAIGQVTRFMSDIAIASREQRTGIGQVNQAVVQMESMTRQNAQLVEQAEGQSQRMQDQAVKLAELVSSFQLCALERRAAAVAVKC